MSNLCPKLEEGIIFKTETDAKKQRTMLYHCITANKKYENQSFEELRWMHEEGDYREDLNLRLWQPSGGFKQTLSGCIKKLVTCSSTNPSWDCELQLPSSQKLSHMQWHHSARFKNVSALFRVPSSSKDLLRYYCHRVIIVARAPEFFEKLVDKKKDRPVDIVIKGTGEFDGEEMAVERNEDSDDDDGTKIIPLDAEMDADLEVICLNEVVKSLFLEVFLYYAYFEEAELSVFNNEQLLEVINLCSKISAQGLANVAITELGKRLRKGQSAYLSQMYSHCSAEHISHQQTHDTSKKQLEMEAETGMQIQPLDASLVEPIVTDNEMLGGDDSRVGGSCQVLERSVEKRSVSRTVSMTVPADSVPVPVGMAMPDSLEHKEESLNQVVDLSDEIINTKPLNHANEASQVQDMSATASRDEEPREDITWWSPLHLIAKTQEWNIPQLEDVLINAHILINYEENTDYEKDEKLINNIPPHTLMKMVRLHMVCFRNKMISSIDPEVQAVSLKRSLNEDLHRLFEEQDERWSDCTVIVRDQCFKCHKVILASRSRYFQSFCSPDKPLVITNFTAEAIRSLLIWIYSDKVLIDTETSMELLGVTAYFQLPSSRVEQKCVTTLLSSCSPSTLPAIMTAAMTAKATQMCLFLGEIVREYDPELLQELMPKFSQPLLIALVSIVCRPDQDRPGFYDIKIPKLQRVSTSGKISVGLRLCFQSHSEDQLLNDTFVKEQSGRGMYWHDGEVLAIDGEYIYFQYGPDKLRRWVRGEENGELCSRFKPHNEDMPQLGS
jgi:hypothetical protein